MNIHFIAGQRVDTKTAYRTLGQTKANNTAKPPLTREGKTYPGGRSLRRRLAKLAVRSVMETDRRGTEGYTKPGSMRG